MAVYLRDDVWYMRISIKGKRYHRAIPEATNKRDAEKVEAIFRSELLQGKYNFAENKGERFFRDVAEEYREYAKTNNIAWKKDQSRVNKLIEYFGNKKLREITPMAVERYRFYRKNSNTPRKKPLSNASVNREIAMLRKMFNIAICNGWVDDNPCSSNKVKPLREDSKRERFLSPDEEERLLSLCVGEYAYLKPILICALHTGMRKGEILKLTWDRVDMKKGYIKVTKTKTGLDRNIPITPTLMKEFKKLSLNKHCQYVFANPITQEPYYDLKRGFNTLLEKASIEGLVFHCLRHTAATRMVAAGIDLVIVKEILGHSCIDTTMRYSHPVPERKLQAIAALDSFCNENKVVDLELLKK